MSHWLFHSFRKVMLDFVVFKSEHADLLCALPWDETKGEKLIFDTLASWRLYALTSWHVGTLFPFYVDRELLCMYPIKSIWFQTHHISKHFHPNTFPVRVGLRQGCLILFAIFRDRISRGGQDEENIRFGDLRVAPRSGRNGRAQC